MDETTEPQYLPRTFDASAKRVFLDALCKTGIIGTAAAEAGFSPSTINSHRRNDPVFAAAFEDAMGIATTAMEDEAIRRGFQGWEEGVWGEVKEYDESGKLVSSTRAVVGQVRKYSDALLMFLLRARKREYRLGSISEVTGAGGGPIQVSSARELSSEQLMQIASTAIDVSSEQTGGDQ